MLRVLEKLLNPEQLSAEEYAKGEPEPIPGAQAIAAEKRKAGRQRKSKPIAVAIEI